MRGLAETCKGGETEREITGNKKRKRGIVGHRVAGGSETSNQLHKKKRSNLSRGIYQQKPDDIKNISKHPTKWPEKN